MKSVLISINPKWVKKIVNGDCTILVSKTVPKCGAPFKCYIYCTKQKPYLYKEANPPFELFLDSDLYEGKGYDDRLFSGKVIGEFVCDSAEWMSMRDCDKACMTLKEAVDYSKGKKLYAWHISDLKIYDKSKELREFFKHCSTKEKGDCFDCDCLADNDYGGICTNNLTRPPQSWCYVEEL